MNCTKTKGNVVLFLLTGEVQSGKTRWLENLLAQLAHRGVESCGVVAPGVWRRCGEHVQEGDVHLGADTRGSDLSAGIDVQGNGVSAGADICGVQSGSSAVAGVYEKLGIDNVLLPDGVRLSFARRRDLAQQEGMLDPASQSATARLAWEISDAAIAQVNAHFDTLAQVTASHSSLLVVDELGRLELEHGCGLTSAVDMLSQGATARFPHALVVVRSWLRSRAEERFADVWGGVCAIEPGDVARDAVFRSFDLAPFIDN